MINSTQHTATKGVLLINLGTPDSPGTADVRKYLRQFLMDERVIDIPDLNRFLLVQGIIAPFRAPKSAKIYKELWTEQGSPLLIYGEKLQKEVQEALGPEHIVELGMRYQSPSVVDALDRLHRLPLDEIIIFPLFPQYASASTGSVHQLVMERVSKWLVIPKISFVSTYATEPSFINAFVEIGRPYLEADDYDHVLFSYHGLPERQIIKSDEHDICEFSEKCCGSLGATNRYCYRAQCFATTRMMVKELGIADDNHTVAFQSRLGKTPWIKPYSDEVIKELAAKGVKRLLVFSPSFVADCLETTIEIGEEYRELFIELGGEKLQLVESLNVNPLWIKSVADMVRAI